MSQSLMTDCGDHSLLDLTISKPGRLGIEFRQTSAPYFVVKVSDEAKEMYSVLPGDLLVGIRRDTSSQWTATEDLPWAGLIDVLKNRPAFARFKRFDLPASPLPKKVVSEVNSDISPSSVQVSVVSAPAPESPPRALEAESYMVPIVEREKEIIALGTSSPKVEAFPSPPAVITSSSPISVPLHAPVPEPSSPRDNNKLTVVYSTEGALGLEFEQTDFPFRVSAVVVGSMSHEKGVCGGDCLVMVNDKSTASMVWHDLRKELSRRPSVAIFERNPPKMVAAPSVVKPSNRPVGEHAHSSPNPPVATASVWGLAAGLLKQVNAEADTDKEREEVRRLIEAFNAEDIESLKQRSMKLESVSHQLDTVTQDLRVSQTEIKNLKSQVQSERTKNSNLIQVIEEMESSHSSVILRFESSVSEKSRQIASLSSQVQELSLKLQISPIDGGSAESVVATIDLLNSTISAQESRIESMEKDNTRLRKENTDLSLMVQQCLEKIQKDTADKPHWVDRRVVCAGIGSLLAETSDPHASLEVHAVARQRLGDVLGLTREERMTMGLLNLPASSSQEPKVASAKSFGENFVSFLQQELDTPTKPSPPGNDTTLAE